MQRDHLKSLHSGPVQACGSATPPTSHLQVGTNKVAGVTSVALAVRLTQLEAREAWAGALEG